MFSVIFARGLDMAEPPKFNLLGLCPAQVHIARTAVVVFLAVLAALVVFRWWTADPCAEVPRLMPNGQPSPIHIRADFLRMHGKSGEANAVCRKFLNRIRR